ncbi:MAG TPA: low affinity iron permease family protein [Casimicrobiaceae bacterium]|jgi:low affinity Fe/Cu permease|nr:low affinity iron permease family protein [Casimicrobiaceae bacterium]
MPRPTTLNDRFHHVAGFVSRAFGSPWALAIAVATVVAWALSGRYFGWSNGWQLVINTGTTIVTFLMAFLIQSTQFRESKAINLKLDELLRAVDSARTGFVNVDELCDDDLDKLAVELQRLGKSSPIRPADPDSANERAQSTAAPRRSAPRAAAQKNHSVARRRSRGAGS